MIFLKKEKKMPMIKWLKKLFPLMIYNDVMKALSTVLMVYRCSSSDLPSPRRPRYMVNFMSSITKCG